MSCLMKSLRARRLRRCWRQAGREFFRPDIQYTCRAAFVWCTQAQRATNLRTSPANAIANGTTNQSASAISFGWEQFASSAEDLREMVLFFAQRQVRRASAYIMQGSMKSVAGLVAG